MIKMIKEFLAYKKRSKVEKSDDPHFTLELLESVEDGMKVEMDWNKAFIKQLRGQGYQGINDEQVIEAYLHRVFERAYMRNVVDELGRDDSE